jgi:hypothetical protein
MSLGDAGALLIGVGDRLRTPRKADPSGDQNAEAKRLHGVSPMMCQFFPHDGERQACPAQIHR